MSSIDISNSVLDKLSSCSSALDGGMYLWHCRAPCTAIARPQQPMLREQSAEVVCIGYGQKHAIRMIVQPVCPSRGRREEMAVVA
jgi:hypothetical protein